MNEITLRAGRVARGTIRPPGSKSITNRALVCAAWADGTSRLVGALDSEDTRVMVDSLQRLGIDIQTDWNQASLTVGGCRGHVPSGQAELFVANSGTTLRFLTAMLATAQGQYRLVGVPRMHQRPVGDLVDALQQLGAAVKCHSENRCPPVELTAGGLSGGAVKIRGDVSSQFLSGLLMAACYATHDITIEIQGELVSEPYVDMTLAVMRSFGVHVERSNDRTFQVMSPQVYQGHTYHVEPDASAASYFWAAAAVTGGQVTVQGLSRDALQGDVRFCEVLRQMGCRVDYESDCIRVTGGELVGVDVNMNDISDTVPTLAVVAALAAGPTTIRDVEHIRHKETDRISDLARELRKLGAEVDEFSDGMTIRPGPRRVARIATYDDHRMAMSFAVAGLVIDGITIENPGCTEKTYPEFFTDLESVF